MVVNAIRISGISVGEGVTTAADVIDNVTSALEQDAFEIFIEVLRGKQNVFDNILKNGDVSDNVVLTLIADDNASIIVHVSQPNRGSNSFTSLSFSIFNATFRTCILPFASKQNELVINFPDISSLEEGVFECKEKKRVDSNRCDYNLKWFLSEALKKHIMDTDNVMFGEEEESSNEEYYKNCKDMVSFTAEGRETFKGIILNKTDADMMKRLFQQRLRSGKVENEMICCLNPDHDDIKPSMKVTVLPFSWQKSKKIVVDEELDEELMDLYHMDKGVGTKFTYISDNAVRDTRTGKTYILYTIRKVCYSCYFRC